MSWQERLTEGAYTSPSGERMVFQYEDVQREITKKTTAFDFPDADGTYVQDLGSTGRRYPLRLFFSGDDYDLDAARFEDMLAETGNGRLEHPVYGIIDVVPFGTITRRDLLVSAGNQAIIEVSFFSTIGVIYPTSQLDPSSDVVATLSDYSEAISNQLDNDLNLDSAADGVLFRNDYQRFIDTTVSQLRDIADKQDDVRTQFNNITESINRGIEVLIDEPLDLAFQTVLLIQEAGRAVSNINDRLQSYGGLIDLIASNFDDSNEFHNRRLFVFSYVTGQVVSVLNNTFDTKPEAIQAAEFILDSFDTVNEWSESGFTSLGQIDTGETYQQLQELVAITAGFLVEISFTLRQERRITLDRNRTIIDLAAELYGEVDDQLDFLINSNSLTGSEILELPRGKEIVYYI